jgi:hypothetical protein
MLTPTGTIATITKMNNTRKARKAIAEARDLLGGNGILLDFHVMRHLAGIDATHTYEAPRPSRPSSSAGTSLVPAPLPDGRTIRFVSIHADRVRQRTAVHDRPAGAADHRPLLQRYIARELYPLIIDALRDAAAEGLT